MNIWQETLEYIKIRELEKEKKCSKKKDINKNIFDTWKYFIESSNNK